MGLIRFIQKHNENVSCDEANALKRQELMIIQQQREEIRRLREQQNQMHQTPNPQVNFCEECGNKINNTTAKFCLHCGNQI